MNRICIAALMTVMICASGCGPSELEVLETTNKLLSDLAEPGVIQGSRADYYLLLIREGANVNAKDEYGRTPLMLAAQNHSVAIVELLIDKGAEVDARDNDDRTPLLHAAKTASDANAPEVVKLLIDKGADVHARTKGNWTALRCADSRLRKYKIINILKAAGARE